MEDITGSIIRHMQIRSGRCSGEGGGGTSGRFVKADIMKTKQKYEDHLRNVNPTDRTLSMCGLAYYECISGLWIFGFQEKCKLQIVYRSTLDLGPAKTFTQTKRKFSPCVGFLCIFCCYN